MTRSGPADLAVVIVSWNTRDVTRECLRSLHESLDASGLDTDVWVVDNASTDGSAEMVESEFPRVKLVRNTENRGFAPANNQALVPGAARVHLLLNSDTVVLGDAIRKSVEYMDGHEDVAVFGCRVLNPDRTVQRTCFMEPTLFNVFLKTIGVFKAPWPRWFGREHYRHWLRDDERDVGVVTGCCFFVRDEAMQSVGLLDERFFFCGEETDWCRRFKRAGWKVRFAPVGEIVHFGNVSGAKWSWRRDLMLTEGVLRYHRKHSGRFGFALAWLMLFVFHVSRAVLWAVLAVVTQRKRAKARFGHFWQLLLHFHEAWPGPMPEKKPEEYGRADRALSAPEAAA